MATQCSSVPNWWTHLISVPTREGLHNRCYVRKCYALGTHCSRHPGINHIKSLLGILLAIHSSRHWAIWKVLTQTSCPLPPGLLEPLPPKNLVTYLCWLHYWVPPTIFHYNTTANYALEFTIAIADSVFRMNRPSPLHFTRSDSE